VCEATSVSTFLGLEIKAPAVWVACSYNKKCSPASC